MSLHSTDPTQLHPRALAAYQRALTTLSDAGVPFLVGGAYAFEHYTHISRHTKDLDLFIRGEDIERALEIFRQTGYRTELTSPVWIGKAFDNDHLIDIIFNSGNGLAPVDDAWFVHAVAAEVLGMDVWLTPPEEMLWTKSFVMERDRFDGADVAHLLLARAEQLDWSRLLDRFGEHWRVLLSHLILFGYIYPGARARIPSTVMVDLLSRLERELRVNAADTRLCRGPLLARSQYTADVERWGYADARLIPHGTMTASEAVH